ncbi:MAG: DNA translocase FtsK [Synergistaceae bacterium]|nr:DNA translocase FtsK [Synergistaceae bacterium]
MSRRRGNDGNEKGSWAEMLLFVLIIACIYCIMALFGSSLTGEGGKVLGDYLRGFWGGAVIVLLLFALYVSAARLFKLRIPRLRRQFFGTLMLYLSFTFLLGVLKESGWTSESVLFTPGNLGSGLAKFFVLNAGTFITLILVAGSFFLSAVFFGSKLLKIRLPKLPRLKFRPKKAPRRREREIPQQDTADDYPEQSIPEPVLRPSRRDYTEDFTVIPPAQFDFQMPKLKPDPNTPPPPPEIDLLPENVMTNAVEVIDNALALFDSGEMKAPEQKRTQPAPRMKKLRRPLTPVTFPESSPKDDTQKPAPAKVSPPAEKSFIPEDIPAPVFPAKTHDEPAFPPPPEIFGPRVKSEPDREILKHSEKQAKTITSTLKNFSVNASVAHIVTGPTFIQYQLELAPGTKVSRLPGLAEDIAMSLAAMSVRIEAPIPGTRYVGIEVPRNDRRTIALRNIIESEEYRTSSARLPIPLGVKVDGKISVKGLEEMPHILIAGNIDSGRSMFVNACIMSMCSRRTPEELRLILIDPRHVEFAVYDGLPHLMAPPVYEPDSAMKALTWAYDEMEKRTAAFASSRVRNLASFDRKQKDDKLPEIVIVINELADLVYGAGPEIEGVIMRLAQKSGASGIYMMLAAQRPSPDVFTTMIKSNIPARAAFALSADVDSKNIIGSNDALRLTGKGDMLFRNSGSQHPARYQAPYISEEKISDFTEYMFSSLEPPDMIRF